MSRTHPPITDVSCKCYQPQQTDDDRRCGRLWRKLKKGLIVRNHVVTKNDSPNDKSYSLTDWHLKSACWRRPDKSENAKDEIQRPISGGAQHAWCNRGKFSPELQKWFSMVKVDVAKRLKLNKRRKRLPIIYHKITANKTYSTINLQMRVTELEMAIYGTLISGGQPAEQAGGDGQVWQHDAGRRLRLHPGATISEKRSQWKKFQQN